MKCSPELIFKQILNNPPEEIHLFNNYIASNSKFTKMLLAIENDHSIDQICKVIQTKRKLIIDYIQRGIKRKLLIKKDKNIILTANGRWYCIAARYGISFNTLCVLADMYVMRSQSERKNIKFYIKNTNIFNNTPLSYDYTETRIFKNEIMRYADNLKGLFYLHDDIYHSLHKYRYDLVLLMDAILRHKPYKNNKAGERND